MDQVHTGRMRLEPIGPQHTNQLVWLDSDPEVMRYISGGRASPSLEVEDTIRRTIGHRWVAFELKSGRFLGWFGLPRSNDDEYELGYRLCRDAWGRGLATEGSKLILKLAFDELKAERVWAQTMAVNTRSLRVMEACGLRYVRTFHLDWDEPIVGAELGEIEYALTRADFYSGRPS
jgi:RimJ/RimL family protein N-acetyltransferase